MDPVGLKQFLCVLGKDSQKVPVPLVRVVLLSCVRQGCCPA